MGDFFMCVAQYVIIYDCFGGHRFLWGFNRGKAS